MDAWTQRQLDALKIYIEKGFKVFPVDKDKTPLVNGGFYSSASTMEKVTEWWTRWPHAGIGSATGFAAGWFVYDVDPAHMGLVSHKALIETHGEFPTTWCCQSGGGGYQYYFAYPNQRVSGRIGF